MFSANSIPYCPDNYRDAKYVFLANGVPAVQMKVLSQVPNSRLVVADTMDLWINTTREDLDKLLQQLDGLVLNDSEAKLITGCENLVTAGRKVLGIGGPSSSWSKKANMARCSSAKTTSTYCPPFPPTG